MRFKQFINEQNKLDYSHVDSASKEEVIEWIKKNAKGQLAALAKGGTPIWRGTHVGKFAQADNYGLGDTDTFTRKAANTHNFINMIVSNSKKWQDYPRRDSSYICTTDLDNSFNYGDPYLVIPADNANIGIVPAYDFWYGFEPINTLFNNNGVDVLNELIADICKFMGTPVGHSATYEQMIDIFNNIDGNDLADIGEIADHSGQAPTNAQSHRYSAVKTPLDRHKEKIRNIQKFGDGMGQGDDLFSYLEELLDPKKSGFKHTTGQSFHVTGNREVWLGGRAAFIAIEELGDSKKDIEERVKEWMNAI